MTLVLPKELKAEELERNCHGLLKGTSLVHDREETRRSRVDNGAICVETVM